jgi:hypothetical protein
MSDTEHGKQGIQGFQGIQGLQGEPGIPGEPGEAGPPGSADLSSLGLTPIEPVEESDRRALIVQRVNTAIIGMGIAIALLYVGISVLFIQVQQLKSTSAEMKVAVTQIQTDTLTNRENGFRSRAVNCQILVSLGEVLPPACLEAPVVALYDPEAPPTAGANSEGQKLNRALLCGLYDEMGLALPEVCVP